MFAFLCRFLLAIYRESNYNFTFIDYSYAETGLDRARSKMRAKTRNFIKAWQFICPFVAKSYRRTTSRALIARRNLCARAPRATSRSRRFISVRERYAHFAHNSLTCGENYFSNFLSSDEIAGPRRGTDVPRPSRATFLDASARDSA